jgi:hypothetical protein
VWIVKKVKLYDNGADIARHVALGRVTAGFNDLRRAGFRTAHNNFLSAIAEMCSGTFWIGSRDLLGDDGNADYIADVELLHCPVAEARRSER